MAFEIEIDNTTVYLLLILTSLLIYHRFFATPQPLVHPLLLGKQSDVSTVRKKGETGVYRSFATGQGSPFTVRPANTIKTVKDVVQTPKGTNPPVPRCILDVSLTDEALAEILRLLPIGLRLLFPSLVTAPGPLLTLLPPSPSAALPLLLLSLSATSGSPLVILPTPRLLTAGLTDKTHSKPSVVVVFASLLDDVIEQVCEDCGDSVAVLIVGDTEKSRHSLVQQARSNGMTVHWWEEIWEVAESEGADTVVVPESSFEDIHSYYYRETSAEPTVVKNITAGMASLLSIFPADKRPSGVMRDLVGSAIRLDTPLGMTIALASIWNGAGFRLIGNSEPIWDPEEVDHAAELEILADPEKDLPKPTILFITPKHHHALLERLQYSFTAHPFSSIAARHKASSLRAGHVDRTGLWDRVLWSGMRENVLGGIAGQRLRGVILVGDAPPPTSLCASHLLLSLPLTRLHPSFFSTGPIFVTHFYDLQSPGVSHLLKDVELWKSADKVHSGPPASNVEVVLKGGNVDEEFDQEGKPISGRVWVRGPSVLERVDGSGDVVDGWVDIGEHAKVQTNGTFIVDGPAESNNICPNPQVDTAANVNTATGTTTAAAAYPSPVSPPAEAAEDKKVQSAKDTKAEETTKKDSTSALWKLELPEEDQHRSELATLWLLSRLKTESEMKEEEDEKKKVNQVSLDGSTKREENENGNGLYRIQGTNRPLTKRNLRLLIAIIPLVWRRFVQLFWTGQKRLILLHLLGQVVDGFFLTSWLHVQSRMMNVVQKSFRSNSVSRKEVLRTAVMTIGLRISRKLWSKFTKAKRAILAHRIRYEIERSYINSRLSLPIPAMSSPFVNDLLYEAGFCAGDANCPPSSRANRQIWSSTDMGPITSIFNVLTSTLELVAAGSVVARIIKSTLTTTTATSKSKSKSKIGHRHKGPGEGRLRVNFASLIIVCLSLAPPTIRLIRSARARKQRASSRDKAKEEKRLNRHEEIKHLTALACGHDNDTFKQETILYGLKDWILNKWTSMKQKDNPAQRAHSESWRMFALDISEQVIDTAFYSILACKWVPTTLKLGDIDLYKNTTATLLYSIREFQGDIDDLYQTVFQFAAFCAATHQPELLLVDCLDSDSDSDSPLYREDQDGKKSHVEDLVDYDNFRQEQGGMKIEAINLSFTYPGQYTPTLNNVNLTLEPGKTLAVVGYNGSGKTTLVKALMGIYKHQGTLLVNDIPVEKYHPGSLHRRQSCLFQDFAKYTLTLRENVGLGWIDDLSDDRKVKDAIRRGGATEILDKVGLKGRLSQSTTAATATTVTVPLPTTKVKDTSTKTKKNGDHKNEGEEKKKDKQDGEEDIKTEKEETVVDANKTDIDPNTAKQKDTPDKSSTISSSSFGMKATATESQPGNIHSSKTEKGTDTQHGLSGGQWQRIALSRAFMRVDQADLVVFDEPSAALDPKAENELFNRIHSLSHPHQGKGDDLGGTSRRITTIYISHRFNTVRKADLIAFVEKGTIIELGSHEQLMQLQGKYCELYNLSKEGFA